MNNHEACLEQLKNTVGSCLFEIHNQHTQRYVRKAARNALNHYGYPEARIKCDMGNNRTPYRLVLEVWFNGKHHVISTSEVKNDRVT